MGEEGVPQAKGGDAQLVLGRLMPGPYAGGAISLDLDKAAEAIRRHLAEPLGLTVQAAAAGLLRLVEQNIQHAVERVSIERGYDVRDFTLVAAGGAGPLHGAAVGRAPGEVAPRRAPRDRARRARAENDVGCCVATTGTNPGT